MSDSVIDAIRAVDPCPEELAPPPIDVVRRRLNAEPAVSARPARARRGPSLSALFVAVSSAAVLAVAVWAFAVLGHGQRSDRAAGPAPGAVAVTPCRSQAHVAVLPPWARAGFSERRPRMPFALGRSGRIAAILWGPLDSPPAADHTNKILWVSHAPVAGAGSDLRIEAQRMAGTKQLGAPVNRRVMGGPGPSIVNLPAAGCWRLTLRWSGLTDHLDLVYGHAR